MPTFKLPPLDHKMKENQANPTPSGMMDYERRITVPVNKDILDVVDIDQEVVMTLRGKVTTKRAIEGENKQQSLEITITEVEVYPDGYEDKQEFEAGYKGD